jgi:putative ABC transport system permease protein
MKFPLYLALQNLFRHPARNLLYILGISITAALLLDMILLSSGLSVSLERILREMGYEVRLSPRGTLPFETDAQITNYTSLRGQLLQMREVQHVDSMLGASLNAEFKNRTFGTFALGLQQYRPVLYHILAGHDIDQTSLLPEVLVNQYLAEAMKIHPHDSLRLTTSARSQTTGQTEAVEVRVAGIASFELDAEGQFTVAMSLPLLQQISAQRNDPVSVVMIKLRQPSDASELTKKLNQRFPQTSAYTIQTVLEAVNKQLSYFKQFSYILGGISLVVTFVLIFIITTISFHDRIGEIALLRAIGLSQRTIFATTIFEGILTSLAAAFFGFLLGKIIALYLDHILTSAPGLPESFSFFVLQPLPLLKAGLTLFLTGCFAGIYPAWTAISLPVADTLREEML